MICCKKCEHNDGGYCKLLNSLNINKISYTPCSIPIKYLNGAEMYMRNTNRTMFIEYINKLLGVQLHIGDELAFINNRNIYGYWHMLIDRPAKQLKICLIHQNGEYSAIDPTYDVCEEEFAQHIYSNPYTMLEPSDFNDVPNDLFGVPKDWYDRVTPINERPERNIIKFISQREKILQERGRLI